MPRPWPLCQAVPRPDNAGKCGKRDRLGGQGRCYELTSRAALLRAVGSMGDSLKARIEAHPRSRELMFTSTVPHYICCILPSALPELRYRPLYDLLPVQPLAIGSTVCRTSGGYSVLSLSTAAALDKVADRSRFTDPAVMYFCKTQITTLDGN